MKKKIALFTIIMLILIFASSCVSAEVGVYTKANGNVLRVYRIIVDSDTPNSEYVKEAVIDELENILENNYTEYGEIVVSEENEYDIRLVYTYSSMTEYYIAMGLTGDEVPEEDNSVREKDLLYAYSKDNMFSDIDYNYIYDQANYYANKYNGNMNLDELDLAFEYGTKYTKLYVDDNADYVDLKDGMRVYRWETKAKDIEDEKYLVSKQPNTGNWYLISIIASLVLCVIMVLITKIKGKKDARE